MPFRYFSILFTGWVLLSLVPAQVYAQETNSIGGYGNILLQRNFNSKTSSANLERFILFVGHTFTGNISFFSELEIEDAKVSGGEEGGEVALEQAYLKFDIDNEHYITAGLFIPRIGILNENHLPNTFHGNERTQVETFILPSTWRELGVGLYGSIGVSGLNYNMALVNGLNSAGFEHGSGIREGRFEGRTASANNLAITGALQLNRDNFKTQLSGYYGGTVGLSSQQADSLQLTSGIFGTPVIIGEVDVQYEACGLSAKILGTIVSISDAENINHAYANNTPRTEYGAYAEVAYNFFENIEALRTKKLVAFVRYERLNMNSSIPLNGMIDETLNQQHVITGIEYLPINNVVIKADARFMTTGEQNTLLTGNSQIPYKSSNTLFNLGIGFSF